MRNVEQSKRIVAMRRQGQQGAVVLLLMITLMLAAAVLTMKIHTVQNFQLRKQRETQVALGDARAALLGFAVAHGRLPRPAISSADGRELPTPCVDDAACTGLLPWVSLGVASDDGWARRLRYSVAVDFTLPEVNFSTAVANKAVMTRMGNKLTFIAGNSDCKRDEQCLPAIILSGGRSGFAKKDQPANSINAGEMDKLTNATSHMLFLRGQIVADDAQVSVGDEDELTWVPLLPLVNAITAGRP